MAKGLAVISGASDQKHKLMDDGTATMGVTSAVSTLSGTVDVAGESSSNLATRINTESGSLASQMGTSTTTSGTMNTEIGNTSTTMVGDTSRDHGVGSGPNFISAATDLSAGGDWLRGGQHNLCGVAPARRRAPYRLTAGGCGRMFLHEKSSWPKPAGERRCGCLLMLSAEPSTTRRQFGGRRL